MKKNTQLEKKSQKQQKPKVVKKYKPKKVLDETKQKLIVETNRHNSIEPAGQVTDGMTLPADIQDSALQQIYQTTVSYLFAFGSVINNEQSTGVSSQEAFPAVAYLIQGIVDYAQGTITIERMPRIHGIIATMLRQRQLRFRYGNVVYTPNINSQNFNTTSILSNGDVFFSIPPDTSANLTITSPSAAIVPSEESYVKILACYTRKECPQSNIENLTELPKVYSKDPSCFARSYAYVGSNGITNGGLINDAELEIPFKMPLLSKFVIYDSTDTQIARILKLQSGGVAQPIANALTDRTFDERHYRNPIPTIYKFLDLNEFYLYITTWMARAMSSVVITANNGLQPQTLPMSKYDFLILLRQAVISQFAASQLQGQFLQPVNQSVGQPNLFRPLVMDPATIPSPSYAGFMLPATLNENLSMLKQASYECPRTGRKGKPSSLRINYVPVWGFYNQDDVADVFVPTGDESGFSLFQSTNVLPTYTSITDLRTSNSNVKVNPNSQQAITLLQVWNAAVSALNNFTQVSSISSDANYTGNLLIYTRVQEAVEKQLGGPLKVQDPSTKFVKDTVGQTCSTGKGKETFIKVKLIQPAILYTRTILSIKPVPQELNNNLFSLFLPSLRLDTESQEDKLTQATWQTYTGEIASQPYEFNPLSGGISMVSRAFNTAGRFITVTFAPTNEQDSLAQALQQLGKHSWGNDLFGQLVSGLIGMVPVVGPVLSSAVSSFF